MVPRQSRPKFGDRYVSHSRNVAALADRPDGAFAAERREPERVHESGHHHHHHHDWY
jgi:hypothetical protein